MRAPGNSPAPASRPSQEPGTRAGCWSGVDDRRTRTVPTAQRLLRRKRQARLDSVTEWLGLPPWPPRSQQPRTGVLRRLLHSRPSACVAGGRAVLVATSWPVTAGLAQPSDPVVYAASTVLKKSRRARATWSGASSAA